MLPAMSWKMFLGRSWFWCYRSAMQFITGLGVLWLGLAGSVSANGAAGVFDGPSAAMTDPLLPLLQRGEVMRVLIVEERMGVARKNELVRVPLFFHAGECPDPASVSIHEATDVARKNPLTLQADDIRRDASGGVSRMHLYFEASLQPSERRVAGLQSSASVQPQSLCRRKSKTSKSSTLYQ